MVQRWDSKGRPWALARGKKCPVDTFLVRGRIPAFPNAVRRTVGGKANVMKPSPTRGRFFVNEEAGFERATQAQPGKNCPVDIILCESPGLQMSLRASAHTGVALSKDSLWSQSVLLEIIKNSNIHFRCGLPHQRVRWFAMTVRMLWGIFL